MKYKIIFFDIGKTLFDKSVEQRTSDKVIKDIIALRAKGIKVGVCTMRTINHCQIVVPTDLDFYISLNGSYIVCEEEIIYDSPIDFIADEKHVITYGKDIAYYSSDVAKSSAIKNGFFADKKGIANQIYNAVIFNINENDLARYRNFHCEYWQDTKSLVIQSVDSSKVKGIEQVLKYYRITEPILYFGDGPNDLDIFKTYHDCICMGDCYPALEKYALFKTGTCRQYGASAALRKLKIL